MKETTIEIKDWNTNQPTGEQLSVFTLARCMTTGTFTSLLDEYLNLGGKGFNEGKQVGLELRFTHRSLQRLAICFAIGILVGLSEQEYTDPRNETAVETAKKIKALLEKGELPFGLYI